LHPQAYQVLITWLLLEAVVLVLMEVEVEVLEVSLREQEYQLQQETPTL
jgi:hypothetical protein